MKKIIGLLVIGMLVFSLGSCAQKEEETDTQNKQIKKYENQNELPVSGGNLNLCIYETDTLNPLLTANEQNVKVFHLLYDGLFQLNQDLSVTPNLCESYEVSADGLTYTFRIKNRVAFHSGEQLTARDVEFSYRLIQGSDSFYKEKLSNIKTMSAQEMQLTVQLHEPMVGFTALLDFPVLREYTSPSIAISTHGDYLPNGTGIYKLQSYKRSKELHLTAYENHHSGTVPYINTLCVYMVKDRMTAIRMMENLMVDLLPSEVINLLEYTPKREVNVLDYTTNLFAFVGLNNQKPSLLSSDTRNALSFVVDREAIVKTVLNGRGVAADLPIPPGSWLYQNEGMTFPYDLVRAKELLEMDGWQDTDQNGVMDKIIYDEQVNLELDILVNQENVQRMKIAQLIKSGLQEIGITTTITNVPFEEYLGRIERGNYDLYIGEMNIPPSQDLRTLLATEKNPLWLSNPELDGYLSTAALTTDIQELKDVYQEIFMFLKTNTPLVGLYFKTESLVFDNKLKGNIMPSISDVFLNVQDWFIK